MVEQGLALEQAAADAFVAGQYDETRLADDGQPRGVCEPRGYRFWLRYWDDIENLVADHPAPWLASVTRAGVRIFDAR